MTEALPFLVAIVALGANMVVSRRWLREYHAAHHERPTWSWITTADPDPTVERWRRWRLVSSVILLLCLAALFVVVFPPST